MDDFQKGSGITDTDYGDESLAQKGADFLVDQAEKKVKSWLGALVEKIFGFGAGTLLLYIILAALIIILFMTMVMAIVYLPNMAAEEGTKKIYAKDKGVSSNDIDIDSLDYQQFCYNPDNILKYLDEFYESLSGQEEGALYVTKPDFKMILQNVSAYQKAVRTHDNTYTYYHHTYKVTKTVESREEKTSSGGTVNPTDTVTPAEPETTVDANGNVSVPGDTYTGEDGKKYRNYDVYSVSDTERRDEILHQTNRSIEDDPLFKVSWEEILSFAAQTSVIGQSRKQNWESESDLNSKNGKVKAKKMIDPELVQQIINDFDYTIGYYFDPTSPEKMKEGNDTYAGHTYLYDEMEKYAYVYEESKTGEPVEHGQEVAPPGENATKDFEHAIRKKPATAPALAYNSYCTITYNYEQQADGTAICTSRTIVIDGRAFYDYALNIIGTDFDMDMLVNNIMYMPGSRYIDPQLGNMSVADRFQLILQSYESEEPIIVPDTAANFVGKDVILGKEHDRNDIQYTKIELRYDDTGDPTAVVITVDPADIPTVANEQDIWNFLMEKIGNPNGVAGIMGNLFAESGLKPNNLQNSYNEAWNISDEDYTARVNGGSWSHGGRSGDDAFIHDSGGYGICQWTYWSRKQGLIQMARAAGKPIDDLGVQMAYLWQELEAGGYAPGLQNSRSVEETSTVILTQFERPKNQSNEVRRKRASYGMTYYNKYANGAGG